MNLRDKLRIYERPPAGAPLPAAEEPLRSMGGVRIETELGPVWRFDSAFPVDGRREAAIRATLPSFFRIAGGGPVELEELLFFDLETTGLSGGTGTYAFLVGVGRFPLRGEQRPQAPVGGQEVSGQGAHVATRDRVGQEQLDEFSVRQGLGGLTKALSESLPVSLRLVGGLGCHRLLRGRCGRVGVR